MKFHAAALQQFGESLLTSSGLAPDRARDVAEILLEGDLLGHTTHGFAPLNSAVGAAYSAGKFSTHRREAARNFLLCAHGVFASWR